MIESASAAKMPKRNIARAIFRWIHILLSIPIIGYIYSPFDKLPGYAAPTRYIFLPAMVVTGLWMWKGHVVRRLFSRKSVVTTGAYANL